MTWTEVVLQATPGAVAVLCLAVYASARPRLRYDIHGLLLLPVLAYVLTCGAGCRQDDGEPWLAASPPPAAPAPAPATSWRDEFPDVEVVPPGAWTTTPLGAAAWLPDWLDLYPALRVEALDEIDTTEAEDDPRFGVVGPGRFGPPPGWRTVGMDPGAFSFAASPTGLANGYVDFGRRLIYVAWRPTSADPRRYPALGHEFGHAWAYVLTGDVALAAQHGHPATSAASPDGAAHELRHYLTKDPLAGH